MKLLVEQSALLKATARVASVVSRNGTIPILNNILIDAEATDAAWLVGTDLDMEMRARLDARVERPGSATVSSATLAEIARNAPKGAEISMALDDDDPRLQVRFGRSRYQMPVLPADDFPRFPAMDAATAFALPSSDLSTLFARTHFAESTEETRYYLCGTYLSVVSEAGVAMLRAVATDGHRLALDETHAPASGGGMQGALIPRKTVGEFRRILDDITGPINLAVSPQAVALETDDVRLISKLIDGTYPDYLRVIPRQWEQEIELDRELLKAAVKRASLISAEKARALKLTLDDGTLTLSVRNMEAGEATEDMAIDYDGPRFETGFNTRYVLDALDQTAGKRVVLRVGDPGSPARLDPHPSDTVATGALCVLMPLRV